MQKKIVNIDSHELGWLYGMEISQIEYDLDELKKLGATHILIEPFENDMHADVSIIPYRFETDDEYNNRIKKEIEAFKKMPTIKARN